MPFLPIFAFFCTTFGAFRCVYLCQTLNFANYLRKIYRHFSNYRQIIDIDLKLSVTLSHYRYRKCQGNYREKKYLLLTPTCESELRCATLKVLENREVKEEVGNEVGRSDRGWSFIQQHWKPNLINTATSPLSIFSPVYWLSPQLLCLAQPPLELSCKLPVTCAVNFRFKHFPPLLAAALVLCRETASVLSPATQHFELGCMQDMTQHWPDKQVWLTGKRTMCRQKGRKAGTKFHQEAWSVKPLLMRDNGCGLARWKSFGVCLAKKWHMTPAKCDRYRIGKMWLDQANCVDAIQNITHWEMRASSNFLISSKSFSNESGSFARAQLFLGSSGGASSTVDAIWARWVSAITYCSIATISQPPTIRISHQCCIMEQITGLRIYCYSSMDAKCRCVSN